MAEVLLEVKNVTMKFGNLVANNNISFEIKEGELVSLIGPNGAGKTTIFNCISGFYKPTSGKIFFSYTDITNKKPHEIASMGLVRTFQIVKPLKDMTVMENVITGAFLRTSSRKEAEDIANRVLKLTNLLPKKDMLAGSLTIADKKRLEIAKALATRPKMLMLDEVMAGLNQSEIKEAMELCVNLNKQGITLLIVEHVMEAIMPISQRVIVLSAGEKIAEGTPEEIVNNEKVITAYLGERYYAKVKQSNSRL
ncbi:MAG: branched-chain amino acid transport system ATP-binding protein [Pseudothermotoga sp.]|jgi:branched-chain amino acid transport system ATP-binding protein|uniref:ABC transporter ATP-binding protein n=1 Tax=Pseudothermotoga sp. TaxID=2033661 RepID=UPI000E909AED|nr:ABC transporter ATP-binding protein [Pseudothermotoga sp.]MDI3494774.1 branched-chain amino acid transport system ATP-binding protein [Pseudothermotoga sp.]MDK2885371.1 branched-chain amino acid transport system ATP-binding protein [Pseudothermotoga sp.]HBJ81959.1 ABC transporter ATP-binding protein [Pseudothermotoga sp.]HBT25327.1 ABC transporter ATP-binding protein [Pseudothermotoga sp.]